jgi:hypothetical protein
MGKSRKIRQTNSFAALRAGSCAEFQGETDKNG